MLLMCVRIASLLAILLSFVTQGHSLIACGDTACVHAESCDNSTDSCVCDVGWTGDNCNECSDAGCVNGVCDSVSGKCICSCGWGGDSCNVCGNDTCGDNGKCPDDNESGCICYGAWTGHICNECGDSKCVHGDCSFDFNSVNPKEMCTCIEGYEGIDCDEATDESGSNNLSSKILISIFPVIFPLLFG